MKKQAKPTETEWLILDVLWNEAPLSVREISERVDSKKMNAPTVRTLTERLLSKKLVRKEDMHGIWVVYPTCCRETAVREEGRGFLQRFFNGSMGLGVAHFIEQEALTDDDIDRIKQALDKLQKRKKS